MEVPTRADAVTLPQCRCIIIRPANWKRDEARDRCGAPIANPDTPLCVGCEQEGHGTGEQYEENGETYSYALVPLDLRSNQ